MNLRDAEGSEDRFLLFANTGVCLRLEQRCPAVQVQPEFFHISQTLFDFICVYAYHNSVHWEHKK